MNPTTEEVYGLSPLQKVSKGLVFRYYMVYKEFVKV